MTTQIRSLVMAVAGVGVMSLGALLWVGGDLFGSRGPGPRRSGLLDLFQEVRQTPAYQPAPVPAPLPPQQVAWRGRLGGGPCQKKPALRARRLATLPDLLQRTQRIRIDSSNFGERFHSDAFGNRIDPRPQLVVLHETVYGIGSAINTFLTPHPRDQDQVSYHTIIGLDGKVVETLDPAKRAFGAGNSAFNGKWVVTNPSVGGSVNNFALHISLETPLDGEDYDREHSGYTAAQYDALAMVLADWMERYSIPARNITTHRHVDLDGERLDPRSFDWSALQKRLEALGVVCQSSPTRG